MGAALPMRSQLVAAFVSYVRARGGDTAALLRDSGLPTGAEATPEVSWTLEELYAFLERAEAACGDPFIGIHVAAAGRRGDYGVLEYVCRSAPTVEGGLRRLSRYASLINELIQVTLEIKGQVARLDHRIPGVPLCVGRHANEFFVAFVLGQLRDMCDCAVVARRAWFAHPEPANVGPLVELLGTSDLAFAREANGLELEAALLERPLSSADPSLLAILDELAEARLAKVDAALPSLVTAVRQAVRESLIDGIPPIGAVARTLGMSRRTLQRRLADDATTYHAVIDDLRHELARAYVGTPSLPLAEIAFLLGYSDVSAFVRAFKRWTGTTPGQLRA